MKIIGLTGKARAGKDTVADYLVREHGFVKISFADPIRAMLKAGFGIDMSLPEWANSKETEIDYLGKSPRQLMQTMGTEWGRELVHPDLWVILAGRKIASLNACGETPGVVVSDVRFNNEAQMLRVMGGTVYSVYRSQVDTVNPHKSENGIDPHAHITRCIVNNATLEKLYAEVSRMLAE